MASPQGLHHGWAQLTTEQADDRAGIDDATGGAGFGLETFAELVMADRAPFEAGPRVAVRIGGIELSDEAFGKPVFPLVARRRPRTDRS